MEVAIIAAAVVIPNCLCCFLWVRYSCRRVYYANAEADQLRDALMNSYIRKSFDDVKELDSEDDFPTH